MKNEKIGWPLLAQIGVLFILAAIFTVCGTGCASQKLAQENRELKLELIKLRAETAEKPGNSATPERREHFAAMRLPQPIRPPPQSPIASVRGPLMGCESGAHSLALENKSRYEAVVYLDGVHLASEAPFVAANGTIYTCLNHLGLHKIETEWYERVAGVPRKVGCYFWQRKFVGFIGARERQGHPVEEIFMKPCP